METESCILAEVDRTKSVGAARNPVGKRRNATKLQSPDGRKKTG
jgi:hypothetical protein